MGEALRSRLLGSTVGDFSTLLESVVKGDLFDLLMNSSVVDDDVCDKPDCVAPFFEFDDSV